MSLLMLFLYFQVHLNSILRLTIMNYLPRRPSFFVWIIGWIGDLSLSTTGDVTLGVVRGDQISLTCNGSLLKAKVIVVLVVVA